MTWWTNLKIHRFLIREKKTMDLRENKECWMGGVVGEKERVVMMWLHYNIKMISILKINFGS